MTAPASNRATRRAKPAKAAPAKAAPAKAAGGRRVDLDAMRAARREARGEAVEVVLGGELFRLPAELPLECIEPLAELAELQDDDGELDEQDQVAQLRMVRGALNDSLAALFGPTDWERFQEQRPSLEDQLALWEALFTAYGVSLGEALARIGSAGTGGAPSSAT